MKTYGMSVFVVGLLPLMAQTPAEPLSLERALENAEECAVILQQLAAVRGAVNGLMLEVLEGHMREHLGAEEATHTERLEDLDQVVRVLRSYLK